MRLPEVPWTDLLPSLATLGAGGPTGQPAIAGLPVQPQFPREGAGRHAEVLVGHGILEKVVPGGRLRHGAR